MRIQLSDYFTYKRLLRFVIPSILMIICTSVYSIIDGFFISNFVGKTPFAAIATAIGQIVGGVVPIIYFARKNDSPLRLTKTKISSRVLRNTCINGSSEMITNLSSSVVNILYNFQLMKIAGENGVAAYGVIMYVNIIFMAIFLGYSLGSAPVISYHYGAGNHQELKNLFRKSMKLLAGSGVALVVLSEIFARPLVAIFASRDIELFVMTTRGFRLYALAFLVMGFNVWGSAFFTALNNGVVSASISFLRTLVFQITVVLILPIIFGIDGIWLSIVVAELLSLVVTGVFLFTQKKRYQYA